LKLRAGKKPPPLKATLAALTDPGCKRTENQDRVGTLRLRDDRQDCMVGIVADGMGGNHAGGHAAGLAVQAVENVLGKGGALRDPAAALHRAIAQANANIFSEAQCVVEHRGMGTTLTIVMLCQGRLFCGHVGDSRLYRLREQRIEQLSHDHSLVGDLVRSGHLTTEQGRQHPDSNILSRAVGRQLSVEADVWQEKSAPLAGDRYLLCSDGLHGLLTDDEILQGQAGRTPDQACRHLVEQAREAGGHDNIAVVILSLHGAESPDAAKEQKVPEQTVPGHRT
jgi:protein phosphatase